MLTDRMSEEPASMLSPLVITASTPKPNPSSLRTVRNHHSYPGVIQQPLSSIPELPSAATKWNFISKYQFYAPNEGSWARSLKDI